MLSRREFGRLTLASLPAATVLGGSDFFTAFAQGKPNSKIDGVQIGTITYSYRSMPDQGAEATLKYIVESGINAVELMVGPIESYAGAPTPAPGPSTRGGRRCGPWPAASIPTRTTRSPGPRSPSRCSPGSPPSASSTTCTTHRMAGRTPSPT